MIVCIFNCLIYILSGNTHPVLLLTVCLVYNLVILCFTVSCDTFSDVYIFSHSYSSRYHECLGEKSFHEGKVTVSLEL